ncbi:MAG: valine--tRNA ligase [Patescibacteria group bacterium]|nr:valine--tRNA ligase [Patescibacteria group bacterium]
MKPELAKAYEPQKCEAEIYKRWEKSGFFNPDNLPPLKSSGKAGLPGKRTAKFSIVLPPPNVTGILHMGHAAMLAIEDLVVRYKRMRGYKTLWLPGVDHAAIATQAKVEKILLKEKKLSRHDLGRKKFLQEVAAYVETTRAAIISQIKKMGSSLDWSRMTYTLDEARTRAVRTVFKKMYDDGLIYRGERIVNWCPRCGSTLSDDEVEHRETEGKLYFIKYGPLVVATTRPETKIGDTAAAVHPDDERYRKYHGKEIEVPLGKIKIKVKVIADPAVDPAFGTGVVGVTPAHSQDDFAMAGRHKLPLVRVIGTDGRMTSEAGPYAGLASAECREKFIDDLVAAKLLSKIEDYPISLSVCYRCETPIEPLPSLQWFVDVNKKIPRRGKSLKQLAAEAVREGDIKIIPDRFEKIYFHWMDNLRDWCISRQIWFGHRIPVWYCISCTSKKVDRTHEMIKSLSQMYPTGKEKGVMVSIDEPKVCPYCGGSDIQQDPDTLDTWFSSGLWTFSTLGWPEENADLKNYHPTDLMETGYDIIFFWVARMILMTTYVLDEIPFSKVYLHGLVRDELGRKMSKSLGNQIDPVEVAEKFGTDAVRLSLLIGASPGNDMKMSEEKIAGFRNFANKLWNISRYVLTSAGAAKLQPKPPKAKTLADAWILSRFARVKERVEELIEDYQLSAAGELLRDFTWGDFADWYLEISKIENKKDEILMFILERLLALWHPFMPFVTEHIWSQISGKDLLMIHDWPKDEKKLIDKKRENEFGKIQELVTRVRNLRAAYKIDPAKKINLLISAGADEKLFTEHAAVIAALARAEKIEIKKKIKKPGQCLALVVGRVEVFMPVGGVIDLEKELARLKMEAENLQRYIRSMRINLDNPEYLSKAPKNIVELHKANAIAAEARLEKLNQQIKAL